MSDVPSRHRKVVRAISRYVRVGNVRVGGRLPSGSTLADDTGVVRAMVAKACSLSDREILVVLGSFENHFLI